MVGGGSSSGGSGGRLHGFDGLRAIAACSIVVLHVTGATNASVRGPFSHYFARFDAGVAIFFVISGFLLYRPFVAAHLDAGRSVAVRHFYWRRAIRIYPAYWIALTATIVLFGTAHIHGAWQYVQHYLLVQIYTPKLLSGIVPAWTLAVEVSFYAVLPAYAWLLHRLTAARAASARIAVELAAAAIVYGGALVGRALVGSATSPDNYKLKWLPFMADWFALGLALAVVKVAYDAGLASKALRRAVDWADRTPTVLAIVGVLAFVAVAHIGLPTTFRSGTVAQDVERQILYGVMAASFVGVAAWSVSGRGAVRAALDARVMVLLGTISYGIFLWHDQILAQLMKWNFPDHVRHGTTLALFVVVFAATVAVATASWVLVERPLLRRPVEGRAAARR